MNEVVIDGSNALLGRLASFAAKQALRGHNVVIINCNKIVLSGNPRMVTQEYSTLKKKGGSAMNGPFFPRSPEKIVKRTVRGMLPYQQGRGLDALKRVMCYNETPAQYVDAKKIKSGKEKNIRTTPLQEISKGL